MKSRMPGYQLCIDQSINASGLATELGSIGLSKLCFVSAKTSSILIFYSKSEAII